MTTIAIVGTEWLKADYEGATHCELHAWQNVHRCMFDVWRNGVNGFPLKKDSDNTGATCYKSPKLLVCDERRGAEQKIVDGGSWDCL